MTTRAAQRAARLRRRRARWRLATLGAVVSVGAVGGLSTAQALWGIRNEVTLAGAPVGSVAFGVSTQDDGEVITSLGDPLGLRIPGAVIAEVMNQSGLDPDPVVWRFTMHGRADGLLGMEFDVDAIAQLYRGTDTVVRSLIDGAGSAQTLLGHSTMVIFRAGPGGDCYAVPDVDTSRNVHLIDAEGVELVTPGLSVDEAVQQWCVAIRFNVQADGEYIAEGHARGTGADGFPHAHFDPWSAYVAFPPSIPPLGNYAARGAAEGIGEDGMTARDFDEWYSPISPDPAGEPDVLLRATPRVIAMPVPGPAPPGPDP